MSVRCPSIHVPALVLTTDGLDLHVLPDVAYAHAFAVACILEMTTHHVIGPLHRAVLASKGGAVVPRDMTGRVVARLVQEPGSFRLVLEGWPVQDDVRQHRGQHARQRARNERENSEPHARKLERLVVRGHGVDRTARPQPWP